MRKKPVRMTLERIAIVKGELVRHEFRAGEFRQKIAEREGVSRGTIDDIATGRNYGWVQPGGAE